MSQVEQEQLIGRGTADLARKIAESKLGVTVPANTMAAWVSLSRTIRAADDFIDNEPSEEARNGIYSKAVNYLSGDTEELEVNNNRVVEEMGYLRLHLSSVSNEQRATFLRNLRTLLRITEQIKKTEKPADLAKLTMLEGQVTARLFTSFLPEEFSQAKGYENYIIYFTRLARGVNAFDSLVDFSTDYSEGKIRVKPSLVNVTIFTANTLANTVFIATHTSPSLIRSIGTGARTVARDRMGKSSIHFAKG